MTVDYHGISIEYTAGQWERLQAIKQKHFDNPDWKPPKITPPTDIKPQISTQISARLYERVRQAAARRNISISRLLRMTIEVIADDST